MSLGRFSSSRLACNVVGRRHQLFEKLCGCSHVQWPFLNGCSINIKNVDIATKFSRIAIHVLSDVRPSVPQRGEPLVSVLRSRELKSRWERERFRKLRRRPASRKWSDESGGGYGEDDKEGTSEEESVA